MMINASRVCTILVTGPPDMPAESIAHIQRFLINCQELNFQQAVAHIKGILDRTIDPATTRPPMMTSEDFDRLWNKTD